MCCLVPVLLFVVVLTHLCVLFDHVSLELWVLWVVGIVHRLTVASVKICMLCKC